MGCPPIGKMLNLCHTELGKKGLNRLNRRQILNMFASYQEKLTFNGVICTLVTGPGGHQSQFSFSWLADNSYEEKKRAPVQPRILWNADIYKSADSPSAKWDRFMSCDSELKSFLQNYLLYGIAFVDDVPPTVEATESVTQRVSLIRYCSFFYHFFSAAVC